MEGLKTKSRILQKKFQKQKGACINPLSTSKPLKPKIVNQLGSDLILTGKNIRLNEIKSSNAVNSKKRNKTGSKTFLYIKSQDMNSRRRNRINPIKSSGKEFLNINQELKISKDKETFKKSQKSSIMLNIQSLNKKETYSTQVMWNPSTHPQSKRHDVMVRKKKINRIDSFDEGKFIIRIYLNITNKVNKRKIKRLYYYEK